jgi:hypothetical protein
MPSISRSAPAGPLYRLRNAADAAAKQARADIKPNSPLYEHEALARVEALVDLADGYIQQIHRITAHDHRPIQTQLPL